MRPEVEAEEVEVAEAEVPVVTAAAAARAVLLATRKFRMSASARLRPPGILSGW